MAKPKPPKKVNRDDPGIAQAIELLARQYDAEGLPGAAERLRNPLEYVEYTDRRAIHAIASALAPPEGWVLMPVRANDEMLEQFKRPRFVGLTLGDRYARLLAARPEVPRG